MVLVDQLDQMREIAGAPQINDKAAEMLKRQAEEELIRKDLRPA